MLNPNEISPRHLPAMQAAILKHRSVLDEHQVSKLYRTASTILFGKPITQDSSMLMSRMEIGKGMVVATCTDAKTGLFVQLAGIVKDGPEMMTLTFGQKYCQEIRDGMRLNIATKIW